MVGNVGLLSTHSHAAKGIPRSQLHGGNFFRCDMNGPGGTPQRLHKAATYRPVARVVLGGFGTIWRQQVPKSGDEVGGGEG